MWDAFDTFMRLFEPQEVSPETFFAHHSAAPTGEIEAQAVARPGDRLEF